SNAAASAGTTLWLEDEPSDPHADFLHTFTALASRYLGADATLFADLPRDWLSVYAWVTDPWWTDKPILYSGLELADLMLAVLAGNLRQTFAHEQQVYRDWCRCLNLAVPPELDAPETDRGKKLQELLGTFKVPVIFRDVVQIKKLADVLATLQTLK